MFLHIWYTEKKGLVFKYDSSKFSSRFPYQSLKEVSAKEINCQSLPPINKDFLQSILQTTPIACKKNAQPISLEGWKFLSIQNDFNQSDIITLVQCDKSIVSIYFVAYNKENGRMNNFTLLSKYNSSSSYLSKSKFVNDSTFLFIENKDSLKLDTLNNEAIKIRIQEGDYNVQLEEGLNY